MTNIARTTMLMATVTRAATMLSASGTAWTVPVTCQRSLPWASWSWWSTSPLSSSSTTPLASCASWAASSAPTCYSGRTPRARWWCTRTMGMSTSWRNTQLNDRWTRGQRSLERCWAWWREACMTWQEGAEEWGGSWITYRSKGEQEYSKMFHLVRWPYCKAFSAQSRFYHGLSHDLCMCFTVSLQLCCPLGGGQPSVLPAVIWVFPKYKWCSCFPRGVGLQWQTGCFLPHWSCF